MLSRMLFYEAQEPVIYYVELRKLAVEALQRKKEK